MDSTSCLVFIEDARKTGLLSLVYYSHLIPIFISFVLVIFLLLKTKFSLLSKSLSIFCIFFCIWFLGDLIIWGNPNYNLISFIWSILDYINILFYLFGAYFFTVLIKEKDISFTHKIVFFALSLPAWWITISGNSITEFNQPFCEAFNNENLTLYKLGLEVSTVIYIIYSALSHWKSSNGTKRKQILIVGSALILFFGTFSITEFISSQTGIYEINLYSLFVLPVFLAMMIYSVINLQMFQIRFYGIQLLIYVMLIMVGSQFFFLENTTDKTLTVFTFLLSLTFGYFLMRSIRREQESRATIEKLADELSTANEKLKGLDKLKTEFLSLASHQLRSPLTAIKGYTSMVLDGTYGPITEEQKEPVTRVYQSTEHLVKIVEDLLNVSKIEQGGMVFNMTENVKFDTLVKDVFSLVEITAKQKGLDFILDCKEGDYGVTMDQEKMRQVVLNLMDNSMKYTKEGSIHISLFKPTQNTIRLEVKDTGMGVPPEIKEKLFQKFSRGDGARMNTSGSGLGLYIAKEIVAAHKGNIWVESEGAGKGSTFIIELFQK